MGRRAAALQANFEDVEDVIRLGTSAIEFLGGIDCLVNNAQGLRPTLPLEEVGAQDMNVLLDTGPKAALWGMQAVFPQMRAQGWGRIVNVASAAGLMGAAGYGLITTRLPK